MAKVEIEQSVLTGYELFCNLIKDGCRWRGDVISRKWSECLYIEDDLDIPRIEKTLESYKDGEDYRRIQNEIWIV